MEDFKSNQFETANTRPSWNERIRSIFGSIQRGGETISLDVSPYFPSKADLDESFNVKISQEVSRNIGRYWNSVGNYLRFASEEYGKKE